MRIDTVRPSVSSAPILPLNPPAPAARPAAAAPGYSNHQQGLSLDLDVRNRRVENWLLDNAHKYGFIRGDNTPDDLVRRLGLAAEGHHYTYRPEFADQAAPRYIQR